MKNFFGILFLLGGLAAFAAEVIPPAPTKYFNDFANVVAPPTAASLNQTLEDFERQTSEQIVVAVFPTMQTDSSVEDYTLRVARAWKVGQKANNNGAVLFVFVKEHKMFIQVGYGLEGALPDALCKRIVEDEIAPHFKSGDFNGGLTAGVQAMLAAAKGEYKGTGRTVADSQNTGDNSPAPTFVSLLIGIIVILVILSIIRSLLRGQGLGFLGGMLLGSSGWSSGRGGSGWSGGGGGGFSGGGGSFGGGGAGGSW